MYKKVLLLVMALGLFSTGVYAGTIIGQYKTPRGNIATIEKEEIHKNRIGISVNGKEIKNNSWYSKDAVTFVPLREIAEMLGAEVKYNAQTMSADIVTKDNVSKPKPPVDNTDYAAQAKLVGDNYVYEGKYFTVYAPKDIKSDINAAVKYLNEGAALALKIYEGRIPELEKKLTSKKTHPTNIYLQTKESQNYSFEFPENSAYGGLEQMETNIKIMAPSLYKGQGTSIDGMYKFDSNFARKTYISEYVRVVDNLLMEKHIWSPDWYGAEVPEWMFKSYVKYNTLVAVNQYNAFAKTVKGKIKSTDVKFTDGNLRVTATGTNYLNTGVLAIAFLIETYGEDKYNAFIDSEEEKESKAFTDSFGSYQDVEKKWAEWLK
ncbi:stalk domain-containing protein [Lysinibacillus sp. 54212]|uniref:stalk domain-containing protein n=1 Tax=Lysinibacillus sp. 54212 TaxID=3119829 RepID=UPI002FC88340